MADLLPGRKRTLAACIAETNAIAWLILAEHSDRLPAEMASNLREAIAVLRRLHDDCQTPR